MQFQNLEPDYGWADKFVRREREDKDLPDVTPRPRGDKVYYKNKWGGYSYYKTGINEPPKYPGLPRLDRGIGSHPPHPLMPGHACEFIRPGPHY